MNEKMKKILAAIATANAAAKGFMENGEGKDVTKAEEELAKVKELQREYKVEKAIFESEKAAVPEQPEQPLTGDSAEEADTKAFETYVKKAGTGESAGLAQGNNGDIIPKTIANKIVEKVKELSPIISKVTEYRTNGTLSIPVYSATEDGGDIKAGYQGKEFDEISASSGKFTTVDLSGNVVGSLALISKKLINNADIAVTPFVINKVGKAFADFFESELLGGEGGNGKMKGAVKTGNVFSVSGTTLTAITSDSLIDIQLEIPEVYQKNACWIMNKKTFAHIRKLKDKDNSYIMTKDFTAGFGWELLGKPVYISENMKDAASGNVPILYGDFAGIAFKFSKDVEIQVLYENYATKHAVGVVGWCEADSEIENEQMFVAVKLGPAG